MTDYVCKTHFRDTFLMRFFDDQLIKAGAGPQECELCAETSDAILIDDLVELLGGVISRDYERVSENPPDFEDGDFVTFTFDLEAVLDAIDFISMVDADLLNNVIGRMDDDDRWVPVGLAQRTMSQRLGAGWRAFRDHIAHTSRFLLVPEEPDPEWDPDPDIRPTQMLHNIGQLVTSPRHDLISTIEPGTEVFRARAYDDKRPTKPEDFVSPPVECASQGRMNAAGISVLYGAFDAETAASEVYGGEAYAAIAKFTVVEPLQVIDLTAIPEHSIFDLSISSGDFERARFLQDFASDIAKPIVRDDRVHYEYVPTQYVTEYLHWQLGGGQLRVDGIIFHSARRPAGRNVVIFAKPDDCLGTAKRRARQRGQLLELDPAVQIRSFGSPTIGPPRHEPLKGF